MATTRHYWSRHYWKVSIPFDVEQLARMDVWTWRCRMFSGLPGTKCPAACPMTASVLTGQRAAGTARPFSFRRRPTVFPLQRNANALLSAPRLNGMRAVLGVAWLPPPARPPCHRATRVIHRAGSSAAVGCGRRNAGSTAGVGRCGIGAPQALTPATDTHRGSTVPVGRRRASWNQGAGLLSFNAARTASWSPPSRPSMS